MRPRILVTGPVNGIERWVQAARDADWSAEAFPLLSIEHREVDLGDRTPDRICITSGNALPALESLNTSARTAPCAVVGERTAELARAAGLTVDLPPAVDAAALAELLRTHLRPGARVLWPRGDRAFELGELLREYDFDVDAPSVYDSVPVGTGPPDETDAVFLASPSAVEAWLGLVPPDADADRTAIAIGETTLTAIAAAEHRFRAVHMVVAARPGALAELLCSLASA